MFKVNLDVFRDIISRYKARDIYSVIHYFESEDRICLYYPTDFCIYECVVDKDLIVDIELFKVDFIDHSVLLEEPYKKDIKVVLTGEVYND